MTTNTEILSGPHKDSAGEPYVVVREEDGTEQIQFLDLPGVLDGDLIEYLAPLASVRTGIVENLPLYRHKARVVFEKGDGTLVCSGPHGETIRVHRSKVLASLGPAYAGWAL